MERSILFVDESGHAGTGAPNDQHGRYLCLVGCAIHRQPYWAEVAAAFQGLKYRHFPGREPASFVLHRSDILRRSGLFEALKDSAKASAFDADLLGLYRDLPYALIGVVIDKIAYEAYATRFEGDAYHWALALLLERYCGLLRVERRIGGVICEARGPHPDRMLLEAYQSIYERGTTHHRHPASFFQDVLQSKSIRFLPKLPAVAGLELADGLAKAAKLAILSDRNIIERVEAPFAVAVETAIAPKWNRRWATRQVRGYGKIFFTIPSK
jgi:hypothetical protein